MPLCQAPIAVSLMFATKCLPLGGVVARCGPIAHCRQFSCCEHLKLPHKYIVPHPDGAKSVFDHSE
jgi:hypothetical protein